MVSLVACDSPARTLSIIIMSYRQATLWTVTVHPGLNAGSCSCLKQANDIATLRIIKGLCNVGEPSLIAGSGRSSGEGIPQGTF